MAGPHYPVKLGSCVRVDGHGYGHYMCFEPDFAFYGSHQHIIDFVDHGECVLRSDPWLPRVLCACCLVSGTRQKTAAGWAVQPPSVSTDTSVSTQQGEPSEPCTGTVTVSSISQPEPQQISIGPFTTMRRLRAKLAELYGIPAARQQLVIQPQWGSKAAASVTVATEEQQLIPDAPPTHSVLSSAGLRDGMHLLLVPMNERLSQWPDEAWEAKPTELTDMQRAQVKSQVVSKCSRSEPSIGCQIAG